MCLSRFSGFCNGPSRRPLINQNWAYVSIMISIVFLIENVTTNHDFFVYSFCVAKNKHCIQGVLQTKQIHIIIELYYSIVIKFSKKTNNNYCLLLPVLCTVNSILPSNFLFRYFEKKLFVGIRSELFGVQ